MSIHFNKSEGQHILKNHGLIDTIISKAKVKHTDTVLEIGAGTGSITIKLLQKAKKVIAYETDKKLCKELILKVNKFPELKNKLELIQEDVLSKNLPHFDKCISNIPFNISCPIILKLMECHFKSAYILVQKEFADRLIARPGSSDYSRLSVIVQLLSKPEHVMKVAKNSFTPAPKVDTCFIKIEPKVPRVEINVSEFNELLKICFGRKNKTLSGNLKVPFIGKIIKDAGFDGNFELIVDEIIESANLKDARTSKMDIEDFLTLLLEFKKRGFHFD